MDGFSLFVALTATRHSTQDAGIYTYSPCGTALPLKLSKWQHQCGIKYPVGYSIDSKRLPAGLSIARVSPVHCKAPSPDVISCGANDELPVLFEGGRRIDVYNLCIRLRVTDGI